MATTAEVITQTSTINTISQSISITRSTLSSSKTSIERIQKIIANKTKVRNDLFFKNQILEQRRREASRRRDLEDQIEMQKVSTNVSTGLKKVSSSSGQGPLGRILSFLGYMGAGWLIENLPTWLAMSKEFIARMKKAGEIIYSIPNTMWRILQNFGQVLKSTGDNILSLDFTDSSNKVRTSFEELTDTVDLLGTQIVDGFKLMLQPSGEVDIPSTGEQESDTLYPDVPAPSSPSGDGGGNVGPWRPLLDVIAGGESASGGYEAMYPSTKLSGATKMTIAEVAKKATGAVGKYQQLPQYLVGRAKSAGLNPEKDLYSKENQDLIAAKVNIGINRRGNDWLAGKITDEQFGNLLSMEFAALKQPNGRGYYDGDGKNKATVDWKVTKSALQKVKSTPSTPSTPPKPTAPPRPVSTGTMNLIPQTGSGGFIQGGSGSAGDATYATHFHIDAKTANPDATQLANIREVAFQAVKAMFARGSWVHFGNIKQNAYKNTTDSQLKSLIAAEQRAHDKRSSAGVDIQEHNPKTRQTFPSQPGSATKFPFAVGEVYMRGGYGREAEIIGSNGITVSHGAAGSKASGVSSQASPQISAIPEERNVVPSTEPEQPQPEIYSLTPEQRKQVAEAVEASRKGQEILFIDDRSNVTQPVQSPSRSSYSGGGSSGQITEFDMLNKFMKQKLLLDFNYL